MYFLLVKLEVLWLKILILDHNALQHYKHQLKTFLYRVATGKIVFRFYHSVMEEWCRVSDNIKMLSVVLQVNFR